VECEAAWSALESERPVDAALLERAGRHVERCRACQARLDAGALPPGSLERHRAPAALAARIGAALDGAGRGAAVAERRGLWRRLAAPAAAFLVGVVLAGAYATRLAAPDAEARLIEEAVSAHVRVRLAGQPMQVASSDRHTVKPWFAGRLDLSPPVQDLTAEGFPLQGARVDYLARRPAAALVYRHRQHSIDLFVLPVSGASTRSPTAQAERGFNTLTWTAGDFRFVAVSDLNAQDLAQFQALLARP
jgi:anti-sigma factor RsiW